MNQNATTMSKAEIEMHLKKCSDGFGLTNHIGKSAAWERFYDIYHQGTRVNDLVACKDCKQVYKFKSADGVHSLLKHKCMINPTLTPNIKETFFKMRQCSTTSIADSDKEELNRKVVEMAALDFRPLGVASCQGFKSVAKCLLEIGHKYGKKVSVDEIFLDKSRYSRRVLS